MTSWHAIELNYTRTALGKALLLSIFEVNKRLN